MSLLLNDFKQGWQNKARHESGHDDSVYVAKNVDFTNTAAIKCRLRHAVHSEYFGGITKSTPIKNLYQLNVEGANKQLIYWSDSAGTYRWNSVTNVTATISAALTTARHISYGAVRPALSTYTYVYITDGITMLCDNGTSTKTWGIDPPESAPTVAISSVVGQLSSGDYSYVYTFYDDSTGTESDPSPACSDIAVTANEAVEVSNIKVSTNSRVTSRRLYRTIADGGTRYLVAIIPDNVMTDYTDIVPDASLMSACVTDKGVPPYGDVVLGVKNMLFMTGDVNYRNRVYNCIADAPDNWPSTYYVEVGKSGTIVQNLAASEGKVYMVTKTGVVGLTGQTDFPDTFTTDDTKATIGTYARWSVASVGGGIYYLGRKGVYRFDGVRSDCVSTPIEKMFWDSPTGLYSVVDRTQAADVCRATGYDGKYYLIVPLKNTAGTVSNELLEYNPLEKQWRLVTTRADDIYGDDGNGVLYGSTDYQFSSATGYYSVYKLLDGDSGSIYDSISVEVVTKNHDFTSSSEDPVKPVEVTYGVKARRSTDTAWIKEYRIDADGTWTFEFFVDGVSRYSITLTNMAHSGAYEWKAFQPKLKGRFIYIKATASSAGPTTHELREIEIR